VSVTLSTRDFGAELLSPAALRNPYPIYRELRETAPVFWSEALGLWLATKYEDVRTIYRDHERFSSAGAYDANFESLSEDVRARLPLVAVAELTRVLNTADRPAHTGHRVQVMRPLAPRRLSSKREWVEQLCADLAERLGAQEQPDLVEHFSKQLSYLSILELFGASTEIIPIYEAAADGRFAMTSYARISPETALRYERALEKFKAALEETYERLRAEGDGTIIGSLLNPQEGVTPLTDDELFATLRTFFAAGHENIIYSVANTIYALLLHPEQLERVREDPSLAGPAYEEALRWESTTQSSRRLATEDVELRGQLIRAGDRVSVWRGSANRDADAWTDPDRFDIDRDHDESGGGIMSFGAGIHFCAGAGLARLEGPIAVQTLLARFPSLRLPEGFEPRWRQSPGVRMLQELPLVLDP
jgi:cytochrome P450